MTTEFKSQTGPFGMADGASEDDDGFIDFRDHGEWGDLEFIDDSMRERFFVGRRGSGKSRYLHKRERAVAEKMLVFRQKTEAVRLKELRRLHQEFGDPDEREEVWIRLWYVAINLALGSFVLNNPSVTKDMLVEDDWNILKDYVRQNLGSIRAPFSVIQTLNQLLTATEGAPKKVYALLNKPDWPVLEHLVAKIASVLSPIAIFIDSLDENFRHAPAESAHAQLGLLLHLSQALTDPSRSNRVHLFVTVRDVIYSQFLAHEQGEKYKNETHWKLLDWRKSAAKYFFHKKIENLPERYLRTTDEKSDPFKRWLGVDKVYNNARSVDEEVGEFLLRHTRFLPREVVEIGNAICNAMITRGSESQTIDIWSLVVKEAEHIGERALEVLYDHIMSFSDEDYPSEKERENYRNSLKLGFLGFRNAIKSEIFSSNELVKANDIFLERTCDTDLKIKFGDLLWQHGLLGYMYSDETQSDRGEVALFYHAVGGTEGSRAYSLPDAERYRLHAALLDTHNFALDNSAPNVDSIDTQR